MLAGKRIIVGVTGSIAAYKAAILVRLLVKAGAEVRVLMTPLAKEFITPLTLATLSKHPILVEFFNPENGEWNSHVSLGEWADAYLDRTGYGQYDRENGDRYGRQPIAHYLPFGALPGIRGSGDGPRHVLPSGDLG